MEMKESLSLYIHIPFCRHRCSYCDFNTYTTVDELRPAYARALAKEIRIVANSERRPVHTVFFGGGTPSIMSPSELDHILTALRDNFSLIEDVELTIEANPDTVDCAYLAALHELGFNRLSFGVQSIHPVELELLGRTHSIDTVIRATSMGRQAGFDNINLDLIYGLPDQSVGQWEESLAAVINIRPEHLSLYCLTIEQGTPLFRQLRNGLLSEPDPDVAADQYELATEILTAAGFSQYEISNWSLFGRECQHNLTYWRNGQYLGLGAGAHGHAAGCRYEVVKQPRVYIRRMDVVGNYHFPLSPAVANHHKLSRQEAMTDTIITQLRLTQEGLDLAAFARNFDLNLTEAFPGVVKQLIDLELLALEGQKLLLTRHGRLLSNQVFRRFL